MPRILLYLLLLLPALSARPQGVLIHETFESYVPGQHLCTQAPSYWTTWNHGPGTAEDPFVSDSIAFDGTRSVGIRSTNDAVLQLGNKTAGRYRISFEVFVPALKAGFFGLLRHFDGNQSEWGVSCYFDEAGQGTLVTGDPDVTGAFTYTYNNWFNVTNIIDVDNDHAEIYVDSTLVLEFTWSAQPGPDMLGIRALDALDLFSWSGSQQPSGAFFDDIVFEELPALPPPRNLQASVSHDTITLTWEAPDTTGMLGYRLYRDSVSLAGLVTDLSYTDPHVYPGIHHYAVKAEYSSGLSPAAGPVAATVEGGAPRSTVLLEIATGTWCYYCPGAAMGADDLVNNGQQVAVIEYHANDSFENDACVTRNGYYQVPGYPTAHFDGLEGIAQGDPVHSMYPYYLPRYETRINKLSLFTLSVDVHRISERQLDATVTATRIYPYSHNALKLRLALTESNIPYQWENMDRVDFACRAMYPNAIGTTLDFSTDTTFSKEFSVVIDSAWSVPNCELIAFLQDDLTKEVLQCTKVGINSMGVHDGNAPQAQIFPNPAHDQVRVKSAEPVHRVELFDPSGRCLQSMALDQEDYLLNIRNLASGIYFLRLTYRNGTISNSPLIISD